MKKFITILTMFVLLLFSSNIKSQTQALTVQGGYSWTMGIVGVEYQFNYLAIGAGVMPSTMPMSGDPITSLSAYLAWTNYRPDESGFYLSLGYASQGYRYEESSWGYYGTYSDSFTNPMGIVNLGYKWQFWSGLNLKGEVGYGFCEYSKVWTYGITAGWTFGL